MRASSLEEALRRAFTRDLAMSAPRVVWIDAVPIASVDAERGAHRMAMGDPLPQGPFDAAVVGRTGDLVAALELASRHARAVVAIVPVEREGLRGMTQRALTSFDRKSKPRALEDACATLLSASISPIRVIEVAGARGECVLHGPARRL